jgi:hypothetical protein
MVANEQLTDSEKGILSLVADALDLNHKSFEVLYGAFKAIKVEGKSLKIDVLQIVSLGIPLYDALAKVLNVPLADVTALVNNVSVPYDDILQAFIYMTSEEGIFSRPN